MNSRRLDGFANQQILLLVALLLCVFPAKAQSNGTAIKPVRQPLKGGVRGAALLTQDGLVKMGESIKDLKMSSTLVITEVTRQDSAYVRGPNAIGNGIIIPAIGGPTGTVPMGHLPPRRKQLTRFVNDTIYHAQLLKNEIDALILPDKGSPELTSAWDGLRSLMSEIQSHVAKLRELSVGPKYDNLKIGKEALAINDRTKSVNKLRKQVMQLIK